MSSDTMLAPPVGLSENDIDFRDRCVDSRFTVHGFNGRFSIQNLRHNQFNRLFPRTTFKWIQFGSSKWAVCPFNVLCPMVQMQTFTKTKKWSPTKATALGSYWILIFSSIKFLWIFSLHPLPEWTPLAGRLTTVGGDYAAVGSCSFQMKYRKVGQ